MYRLILKRAYFCWCHLKNQLIQYTHLQGLGNTWRKFGKKKLFIVFLIIIFAGIFTIVSFPSNSSLSDFQDHVNWRRQSTNVIRVAQNCVHPSLPINNPEIMKHITQVDRITCNRGDNDWVGNNGTHAFITEKALEKNAPITCKVTELEWIDDRRVQKSKKSSHITYGNPYRFENVDFVEVECWGKNGKHWQTFLAAPRAKARSHSPTPSETSGAKPSRLHPRLNVVIWGHDSLSRNMFIRKLPLTYAYLKDELKGHVLDGYNIVGDGTPQALIPMLTGATEMELPEVRRSKGSSASFLDAAYPFVWNNYKKHGYFTGYMEDSPSIGTFQYRLKGFRRPPVDFYMRPYFIAAEKQFKKYMKFCIGSIPRHKIVMNYVTSILNYKTEVPKFIFSFHSELSHDDINLIQGADYDLKEFVVNLETSGILNNTILMLMSDHGHRFAQIRETQQGKLEERKPFVFLRFPIWFEKIYPTAYQNFLQSKKKLSTPFDIHETLLDILRMTGSDADTIDAEFHTPNSPKSRQMSLFRKIPENRTCEMASIEPHWCACLKWEPTNPTSSIIRRAAKEIVDELNKITISYRSICAQLKLSTIVSSAIFQPHEAIMKFKKSSDVDGRFPDLSDAVRISSVILQVIIETTPGNGHFEVSVDYDTNKETFYIHDSAISRINKYGTQANCVENENLEHLRKFCYCVPF